MFEYYVCINARSIKTKKLWKHFLGQSTASLSKFIWKYHIDVKHKNFYVTNFNW